MLSQGPILMSATGALNIRRKISVETMQFLSPLSGDVHINGTAR